ncbi:hypothetical protein NP493_673g02019 [Ridgeia piscesae]|uniref:SH3 domain-containing protein n=1 Tax=Ridgeia piscesae TaxID=27915 RepID=A0AAD9NPS7_RIDPI|nr:hypothetical protein NP493_673g02019 [Ridgeia piscesae]
MSAMAKSTLAKAHMPSPLRNGSEGQSNHSVTHLAPEPSRTGQSAEAPDVPMAGRKSFAGGIKSKLGKARPKSMNFDVLRHKNDHGDPGRTQAKEEGHEGVGKKKPPPRPSTGPLRSAGKLLSHARPGRKEDSQWDQSSSPPKHAHEMSASPPKYHRQEQTTRTDVPHGVALYDYTASQPDELSFQVRQ